MARYAAAVRAPSRKPTIRERFRRPRLITGGPPLGIVEQREVEVLGRPALLVVERVAAGELGASVSVRAAGAFVSGVHARPRALARRRFPLGMAVGSGRVVVGSGRPKLRRHPSGVMAARFFGLCNPRW